MSDLTIILFTITLVLFSIGLTLKRRERRQDGADAGSMRYSD